MLDLRLSLFHHRHHEKHVKTTAGTHHEKGINPEYQDRQCGGERMTVVGAPRFIPCRLLTSPAASSVRLRTLWKSFDMFQYVICWVLGAAAVLGEWMGAKRLPCGWQVASQSAGEFKSTAAKRGAENLGKLRQTQRTQSTLKVSIMKTVNVQSMRFPYQD